MQLINDIRKERALRPLKTVVEVSEEDCYLLIMNKIIKHIEAKTDAALKITASDIKAYLGVRIAQQLAPGHALDDAWASFSNSRAMWGNRWIAKTMLKDEFKHIHRNKE